MKLFKRKRDIYTLQGEGVITLSVMLMNVISAEANRNGAKLTYEHLIKLPDTNKFD
jgi:hypothetical protein